MKLEAASSFTPYHSPAIASAELLLDPKEYDRIREICVFASHMLNDNKSLITGRVEARCESMADILSLNDAITLQLTLAAKVHRVGELLLNSSLQDKCYLDMGLEERRAYQSYPIFSARRVCESESSPLHEILIHHREYMSGEGFLKTSRGADISVGARILCVATEYEELICYKGDDFRKQDLIQRNMIRNLVGKYDTDIIDALMISISESATQH